MTDKPGDLVSALHELDACKASMSAMSEEMAALRDLLKQTTDMLITPMSILPTTAPTKKVRGGQRKDDGWILDAFSKMKAAFIAANHLKRPTDDAVITWYFEQEFNRLGLRERRASDAVFTRKLKRFKNRLGNVRNPIFKLPFNRHSLG